MFAEWVVAEEAELNHIAARDRYRPIESAPDAGRRAVAAGPEGKFRPKIG
jgi:hypothetical protein